MKPKDAPARPCRCPNRRHCRRADHDPRRAHWSTTASLILVLLLPAPAVGAAADADALFRTGVARFQSGDFAAALEAFDAALAAGQTGPAIHFNIGVAAYRSGDLARAVAAFRETAARSPAMAPLAYYNIGLVAQARGDAEEAQSWFRSAMRDARDERLRGLARIQLGEASVAAPARRWYGQAYVGVGHDDNVALIENSELIDKSGSGDEFAEAVLSGGRQLGQRWGIDGWISRVDYQTLDEFDQLSAGASLRHRRRAGSWTLNSMFGYSHSTLDGDGLESRASLSLQATIPATAAWQFRPRYRYSKVDGLEEFGGLDGHRHEWQAALLRRAPAGRLVLAYQHEINDHDDRLLSARAHQLHLEARWNPPGAWTIEAEATFRRNRFGHRAAGERTEERVIATASLARAIGRQWSATLRVSRLNNDSRLAFYDFVSTRISAGIEGRF